MRRGLVLAILGLALYFTCRSGEGDRDPRIPGPSSRWTVWYEDTFDRDAPPSREAEGVGIVSGLAVMWNRTALESINAEGSATFSRFSIDWGGRTAAESAFIMVKPTEENQALARIRGWWDEDLERLLAQTHLRLLEKSDRWTSDRVGPWREADPILAAAGEARDRAELVRRLEAL